MDMIRLHVQLLESYIAELIEYLRTHDTVESFQRPIANFLFLNIG
jgi:hypothetical protein